MKTSVITGLILVALAGCGGDQDGPDPGRVSAPDPGRVEVEIEYVDAALAPEYHRSWTITADQDQMRTLATSYDEVLDDTSAATPAEIWSDFVAALPTALARIDEQESDPGCAGGTGLILRVSGLEDGDRTISTGSCGGDNRAVVAELVTPLVEVAGEQL